MAIIPYSPPFRSYEVFALMSLLFFCWSISTKLKQSVSAKHVSRFPCLQWKTESKQILPFVAFFSRHFRVRAVFEYFSVGVAGTRVVQQ
jgi:hypothetical protein